MLKYVNFRIFIKLFTSNNLSPYFEKLKQSSVLIRYLWITVWFKQTVGLTLCFEPWCEALQPSRKNCQKQAVPSRGVVVCTSGEVIANCVAQMGALNTAEPLSDSYTVQAQLAND